jgi:hypothetical protein
MNLTFDFQPCQIVCLEHEGERLYAEVIQVIEVRQLCWARPLILTLAATGPTPLYNQQSKVVIQPALYDLRQGSDLLWPITLFRAALDTEVLPLLTQLYSSETQLDNDRVACQRLNHFVHEVWQAYPEAFQA